MSEGKTKKAGSGLRELSKLYMFLKPYGWLFALGLAGIQLPTIHGALRP